MRSSMLVCLLVSALLVTNAAALTVRIDCDRGQSLEKALAKLQSEAPLTIDIVGTCVGNFRIWADGVRLRGLSPEESVLVAPQTQADGSPGPVVYVDDADRTNLSNLSIRGGSAGVHARGWDRSISVINCEVSENDVGVRIDAGADAYIQGTVAYLNHIGISTDSSSSASVVESEIRDNSSIGIRAFKNGTMGVVDTDVTVIENAVGISAWVQSSINLVDSRISGGGDVAVLVNDRSRIITVGATEIGCDLDGGCTAVAVRDDSVFQASGSTTIGGDVRARDVSFVRISASEVHGSLLLDEFSTASLFNTTIDGSVECSPGADALCGFGTVAETSGCPSAPPVCGSPTPGGITPDPEESVVPPRELQPSRLGARTGQPRSMNP